MRIFASAGIAGALLVLAAVPVAAQDSGTPARGVFKDGEDLFAACTSKDALEVQKCEWFLMAAHDMATYYQDTGAAKVSFCLPTGTTADVLRKDAVARWTAKPQSRKFSAVSSFLNALDERHPGPCKG